MQGCDCGMISTHKIGTICRGWHVHVFIVVFRDAAQQKYGKVKHAKKCSSCWVVVVSMCHPTVPVEIRTINTLGTLILIEYPTSEYVRIAYVIILSTGNPISLSRILANKVIKGG